MRRMKRKIVPIAVSALALGTLFDIFFYGKQPGVSVLLYTALILLAAVGLADRFRHRLPKSAWLIMPVALFFAAMAAVRASEFLVLWNIALTFYLLLLVALLIFQPNKKLTDFDVSAFLFDPLRLIPRFARESTTEIRTTLSAVPALREKSSYAPYIRGALLSLPFLLVFILLLSSADIVFQRFFSSLFDLHVNGELLFRVMLIVGVTLLFIGAFTQVFMRQVAVKTNEVPVRKPLGMTEATILLGSVGLLFLAFVLVQVRYLFGGSEQVLTTAGLTYAAYARRGFFELIAVAVITMALIWAVKRLVALSTRQQESVFNRLTGSLIALVLVIMLSAHMRLSLYEGAYGFTLLRLLSHLFLVLLAVTFVSLFVHIWKREPEQRFALRTCISILAFFAVLNLINPDALIARQNIDRFTKTGKLDAYYLTQLSADATPTITTLLSTGDDKTKDTVARNLFIERERMRCDTTSWQSFNLARHRAQQVLEQKGDVLRSNGDQYRCLQPF